MENKDNKYTIIGYLEEFDGSYSRGWRDDDGYASQFLFRDSLTLPEVEKVATDFYYRNDCFQFCVTLRGKPLWCSPGDAFSNADVDIANMSEDEKRSYKYVDDVFYTLGIKSREQKEKEEQDKRKREEERALAQYRATELLKYEAAKATVARFEAANKKDTNV